jgi:ATP/maltotriose-dependent transcriptional regulator MalT
MKRNTVERAAGLLVHSMQEADTPIAELSDALARMAQTLNDPAMEVQSLRAEFARNIAVCIESLQSYDRLMQQLAQARDILTGLAANKPLEGVPNGPANLGRIEGTIELF